ncbi:hypothetical protein HY251_01215 [bacterium]|nr:hypothetical protein [bacterium]
MRAPVLALACLVALSGLARADDDPKPGSPEAKKKAGDLVKEASSHWSDKDPKKCRELAEKAHELDPESFQIDAFLGSLYDVKLGEPEKALESYDRAIRSLVGATKDGEKRFKADVIARKGDVLYSYKDDLEGARTCYESSLQTVALSTTADKLSNLLHRLAGQAKDPEKKKKQNAAALEYAEKAHELVAYMTQDRNARVHEAPPDAALAEPAQEDDQDRAGLREAHGHGFLEGPRPGREGSGR